MNLSNHNVLLLNASNFDAHPVYPYAFIQLPAVARESGIDVISKDLLGVPPVRWGQTVQAMIAQHDPAMVLITLRNTDSLGLPDYDRSVLEEKERDPYFPIERTRELITAIRAISDLQIALGGFGFSLLPEEIMRYTRPDLGVVGGPDAFFANFEDIVAGNTRDVANLFYFEEDRIVSNPLVLYPPHTGTEYTPQIIEEMMEFYSSFPSPGFQGAPVEIMRGCCHSCLFCSEPHAAGREVRYRDLSAVMGDIEILVKNGISRIYIVSSELNPEGNDFVLRLADRIRSFNERQKTNRQVSWFGANYLLSFTTEEFERLHESGFTGGWWDITALDDENARTMRTPYRNESLVARLENYARFESVQIDRLKEQDETGPGVIDCEAGARRKDEAIKFSLFLGNPATTSETIRNTLRVANREGLSQLFTGCSINSHIRVFDYEEPDEATRAVAYSVTPELEHTGYQQLLPSFAYSPALLHQFGSEEEVEQMFDHIAETYLSKKYRETRDWNSFIKMRATTESISLWIANLSEMEGVEIPTHIPKMTGEIAPSVNQVADYLVSISLELFPNFFESLGLPKTVEELNRRIPYDLAVAVYSRWGTETEFDDELIARTRSFQQEWQGDLLQFSAHAILYRCNIRINEKYRRLFISDG